jgi:predicted RNase H-like nuclease (RuvC/YqgF family)
MSTEPCGCDEALELRRQVKWLEDRNSRDGTDGCIAELDRSNAELRAEIAKLEAERDAYRTDAARLDAEWKQAVAKLQEVGAERDALQKTVADCHDVLKIQKQERDALRELAGELMEIVEGHHIDDDGDGECPHCTLLARAKALGVGR